MDERWLQQEDESAEQYKAFKTYLLMDNRNAQKCAEMIGKSQSTINRWASKYDWRQRATAYDESLLDDARRSVKKKLAETIFARFEQIQRIADTAAAQLESKIATASARTASETYYSAIDLEMKLFEKLNVFEPEEDKSPLTIKIVGVERDDIEKLSP